MVTYMANLDELLRQSSPGDPYVFEALMVNYYNFIYNLTNSILGDPCEADDATQETFIQATTHLSDYQIGTKIKSWLARIAINLCRDKLRKVKTKKRLHEVLKTLSLQKIQTSPTPEERMIKKERQLLIQSVIEGLDEKHRLPILLRYGQAMPISEIAQVLEVSEGTIHSRLHYAHLKLRDRLDGLLREQNGN